MSEFVLCLDGRILFGPSDYSVEAFSVPLSYHGIPAYMLPTEAPSGAFDLCHLKLLPMEEETIVDGPAEFYHVGQPVITVMDDKAVKKCQVAPYSIEYCAGLVAKEVSDKVDAVKPKLSEGYPDIEVDSWPLQLMEANAYTANPEASVPTLKGIAARRGLELSDLVDRVLAKAPIYSEKIGFLLGSRQFVEDELAKLKESKPENWISQLVALRNTWQSDWPPELLGG